MPYGWMTRGGFHGLDEALIHCAGFAITWLPSAGAVRRPGYGALRGPAPCKGLRGARPAEKRGEAPVFFCAGRPL